MYFWCKFEIHTQLKCRCLNHCYVGLIHVYLNQDVIQSTATSNASKDRHILSGQFYANTYKIIIFKYSMITKYF